MNRITNSQLHAALAEGMTSREIAARYGITPQAVNERRRKLRFTATAVAIVAPPEARAIVATEVDTIQLLQQCIQRMTLLQDAYHEWLLDPKSGGTRYAIGPRSTEIDVVYWNIDSDGNRARATATLQELLDRVKERCDPITVERKSADPRVEIRASVTAISRVVEQALELTRMLADTRAMETFRDTLLAEIAKVDPQVAQRIVRAVRSRLVLCQAPERPGPSPPCV